jgi:hypothetical protein
VEGWLGSPDIKISDDLWSWSKANPTATVEKSLPSLLDITKRDWALGKFPLNELPSGRRIGDYITGFSCVDFANGKAKLYAGNLKVAQDGSAEIGASGAVQSESLAVNGIFTNVDFISIITPDLSNVRRERDPNSD